MSHIFHIDRYMYTLKLLHFPLIFSHVFRFDTYSRSRGPPAGLNTSPPGLNRERKVIIQLDEKHRFIGFNIRGGSEYGLGIFVSK